jgi:hypothetical protein
MRPLSPLVAPYIAPSRPSLASLRLATAPSSTMPWYRSAPRAALAKARSPLMPASTRGSSCATSATTNTQPSSATAAGLTWTGIDSAPPPLEDHRPVVEPAGWYVGRNRPPLTHWSIQVQPLVENRCASCLYRSSEEIPGWSIARSVDARVSAISTPARRNAASSSGRESGFSPGASKASRTSAANASSFCGRAPRGGLGPSSSVSRSAWTSARHGMPAYVISTATRAPADSAASSRPSRVDSGEAATAASCRASSTSARRCSVVSSTENRAGSEAALGPSRSQCADCSPSSSCPSTAGARRKRW